LRLTVAGRVYAAKGNLGSGYGDPARGDRYGPAPGAGSAGDSSRRTCSFGSLAACVSPRSLAPVYAGTRAPNSRVPGCRYYAGNRARP
jgi:hypothetical protein